MPCLWERLVRATRHGDRGMPGQAAAGFDRNVLVLQASEVVYADEDFEPVGYRCSSCGIEDRDLGTSRSRDRGRSARAQCYPTEPRHA